MNSVKNASFLTSFDNQMRSISTSSNQLSFVNWVSSINIELLQNSLWFLCKLGRHYLLWILFSNWVSSVNTHYLPSFLCLLSELTRHCLLNLANIGMLDRHRKLSSLPEWARHTFTSKDMTFCVTSKTIYN